MLSSSGSPVGWGCLDFTVSFLMGEELDGVSFLTTSFPWALSNGDEESAVERRIALPRYDIYLEADGRSVQIEDRSRTGPCQRSVFCVQGVQVFIVEVRTEHNFRLAVTIGGGDMNRINLGFSIFFLLSFCIE